MIQRISDVNWAIAECERAHSHVRKLRLACWLMASALLIMMSAIFGLASRACAATSADVDREISGAFERSEVSTQERWALAAMIVADIAGNESTVSAIGRGCRESNPLYGSSPGRAQLYAVDAVVWGAYLWAANRVSNYRTEC